MPPLFTHIPQARRELHGEWRAGVLEDRSRRARDACLAAVITPVPRADGLTRCNMPAAMTEARGASAQLVEVVQASQVVTEPREELMLRAGVVIPGNGHFRSLH